MRKQIVLGIGLIMCGIVSASGADQQSGAQNNDAGGAAKSTAAIERARAQLARELQMEITAIDSIASEPQTWSDSSLGCGRPGALAAQVITSGYAVTLKTPRGNYRVHTTEKSIVVCGPATQWRSASRPGGRGVGLPLRNINRQVELARADLAQHFAVAAKDIRSLGFVLTDWPDSSMACVTEGETITLQATQGYRIDLQYAGRVYSYHTDLKRMRPCPALAIE